MPEVTLNEKEIIAVIDEPKKLSEPVIEEPKKLSEPTIDDLKKQPQQSLYKKSTLREKSDKSIYMSSEDKAILFVFIGSMFVALIIVLIIILSNR